MKYMILTYGSQLDYAGMAGAGERRPGLDAGDVHGDDRVHGRLHEGAGGVRRARGHPRAWPRRRSPGGCSCEDGVPVVTDGPFAETTEVLAGYWIVECDSFDRATELAGRLAACPSPPALAASEVVDVRPIMESADELTF